MNLEQAFWYNERRLQLSHKYNAINVPTFIYPSHTRHVSADNFGHHKVILQQRKRQNIFQTTPARCTQFLSTFISTSPHVSGDYVPITRTAYCIYAPMVFFTLYGWLPGLADQSPIQSAKYQCRIDTVSCPDDGHIVARNM